MIGIPRPLSASGPRCSAARMGENTPWSTTSTSTAFSCPVHGDFDRVSLRRPLERIRDRFGGRELDVETLARVEPALFRDALHGRAKLSRGRRPAVELQIDMRSVPRENATPPYPIESLMS